MNPLEFLSLLMKIAKMASSINDTPDYDDAGRVIFL